MTVNYLPSFIEEFYKYRQLLMLPCCSAYCRHIIHSILIYIFFKNFMCVIKLEYWSGRTCNILGLNILCLYNTFRDAAKAPLTRLGDWFNRTDFIIIEDSNIQNPLSYLIKFRIHTPFQTEIFEFSYNITNILDGKPI